MAVLNLLERRCMRGLATLVVLALALGACSQTDDQTAEADASPPPPTPVTTPSPSPSPLPISAGTYLALGDSLAVGVGATDPEQLGYVPRIHAALETSVLRNLSVSGETSASLLHGGQLDAALDLMAVADPPVTLVTLDIGGNDLLHLLGSEPCSSVPDGSACQQLVADTLQAFERNYRQALARLQSALEASGQESTLAVMTYFNPFSGTDAVYEAAGERALLGDDLRIDCAAAADEPANSGMNDLIACVGEELGAAVADVHPRFEGLGLELTHIGAEDIHANDPGYAAISEAFLEAIAA